MKTKLSFKQSITAGGLAAFGAVLINSILFFVFHAMGIINDSIFIKPNESLTVVHIIMSSIFPTLIASVVFFLIEKYTKNGFRVFSILSIVLLMLSFISPFTGIPGVTTAYALALNLMHVVVVACLLFFINKKRMSNL